MQDEVFDMIDREADGSDSLEVRDALTVVQKCESGMLKVGF